MIKQKFFGKNKIMDNLFCSNIEDREVLFNEKIETALIRRALLEGCRSDEEYRNMENSNASAGADTQV